MPILPRSSATSIHSWSLVYFSPAGYGMSLLLRAVGTRRALRLGSLVERHRDDTGARAAAADVHVELRSFGRVRDRHVRHADRFLEERRLRAARDDSRRAIRRAADIDVVPMARDAALEHLEAHQFPAEAL